MVREELIERIAKAIFEAKYPGGWDALHPRRIMRQQRIKEATEALKVMEEHYAPRSPF